MIVTGRLPLSVNKSAAGGESTSLLCDSALEGSGVSFPLRGTRKGSLQSLCSGQNQGGAGHAQATSGWEPWAACGHCSPQCRPDPRGTPCFCQDSGERCMLQACFPSAQKCFCCMSGSFANSEQTVPLSVGSRELETIS